MDRVSRGEDCFARGGRWILATRGRGKLSREFGVQVRLRALFESPTVAGLAVHVEALLTVAVDTTAAAGEGREEFEV